MFDGVLQLLHPRMWLGSWRGNNPARGWLIYVLGCEAMKAIFALWNADSQQLKEPAFHQELGLCGAERLHLNLDDESVAPAMRISTGAPINAVVSVWGDELYADGILTRLRPLSTTVTGWIVTEKIRLSPPPTAAGVRAEALANMAFLRRPQRLDRQAWLTHWMVQHTGVAIRTQATVGYIQNIVVGSLAPQSLPVHGIVEELFAPAAMSDRHEFYGSGGDEAELKTRLGQLMESVNAMGADQSLDLVPTSRFEYPLS